MTRTITAAPRALMLAVGLLGCAVAQEPQPSPASQLRRRAYEAQQSGDHASAADAFLELAEMEGSNPDWYVRAAENLGRVGRYNDAMDLLNGVRTKFPDVPEILETLAQTFHLKADSMVAEGKFDLNVTLFYQDVVRTSTELLRIDPKHAKGRLLLASAKFQLGDYDAALEHAEIAVADHPDEYSAHAMLGKVTVQKFVDLTRRFQADQPAGSVRDERKAEIDVARKRARTALENAAESNADRSYPVAKLGDVEAWSGDMERAVEWYTKALAIDPDAKVDHDWLRSALPAARRIEMYETAGQGFAKRADATPARQAVLQWYAAQAHYDGQDWRAARAGFAEALAGRPDFARTYYYLMLASYEAGDSKDASKHALAFAKLAPRKFADMIRSEERTVAILRGMALRSYESRRLVECRELNHVIAFAANTVDEWNNYALLCRDTGKYADSFAAYERALELEESPQLLNDAAVILQYHLKSEDNLRTARNFYERAVEMAESMLEDDELDDDVAKRTRIALRDARNNLRKL